MGVYIVNTDIEIEANNEDDAEQKVIESLLDMPEIYASIIEVKELDAS